MLSIRAAATQRQRRQIGICFSGAQLLAQRCVGELQLGVGNLQLGGTETFNSASSIRNGRIEVSMASR